MEYFAITLSDFADTIMLTTSFKNHFLYPFFAASWGVSPEDMKLFAAYDILKWALVNEPAHITATEWNEVIGGMHTYIDALVKQLTKTKIMQSTNVTNITYNKSEYSIHAHDQDYRFDHIIIATNAMQAQQLLKNIAHAQLVCTTLSQVEYFYTTIAIHSDRRFMPKNEADWSVANIAYDGINSALTICKSWMKPFPVFRSWITYPVGVPKEDALPQPLYALNHFYHPKVNYGYFKAQKGIAALQGNKNIWIAGFYTIDADSHNNAIVSAINIARKLAPYSSRLQKLII